MKTICRTKLFFYLLQTIFCLDFGFVKSRTPRSKLMLKFFLLSHCFGISVCIFMDVISHGLPVPSVVFLGFVLLLSDLNVIILTFTPLHNSFYIFQKKLRLINAKLVKKGKIFKNNNIGMVLACIFSPSFFQIPTFLFCSRNGDLCNAPKLSAVLLFLKVGTVHIIFCVCSYMFYSAHIQMKKLIFAFQNNKNTCILYYLSIYKDIADAVDEAKKPFDYIFAVTMLVVVPTAVYEVYTILFQMKEYTNAEELDYIVGFLHTMRNVILLFTSPVSAGLLEGSAHELEEIIHVRLLQERTNIERVNHLELFKKYLSGRPMRFTLFRVIPLDWTLPVTIVHLCITYQITLVQLTHLY